MVFNRIRYLKIQYIAVFFVFVLYICFMNMSRKGIDEDTFRAVMKLKHQLDVGRENKSDVDASQAVMEIKHQLDVGRENESDEVVQIRRTIAKHNEQQPVINGELYEPLTNDSVVIVVQVHTRLVYVKYLVESLSNAKDIETALLVFSHDVYDPQINDFIGNITFAKTIQIFYPHSPQAYPNEFPGNDSLNCPQELNKDEYSEMKCFYFKDYPGEHRGFEKVQLKHHWWWKLNYVFNHIHITKYFTGLVLLMEEDHYVGEDFIYMLKIMEQECNKIQDCAYLGLGKDTDVKSSLDPSNKVYVDSSVTNLGLTLNRATFQKLHNCAKSFCQYNDYNWDWTLFYVSRFCVEPPLLSLISTAPRMFHIGECGTHIHKKTNCEENQVVPKIKKLQEEAKKTNWMFPPQLSVLNNPKRVSRPTAWGGWMDVRDQQLCLLHSNVILLN